MSLLEVAVSTLIVGLLLVTALKTAGHTTSGQIANGGRSRANLLAGALMAEILERSYQEPDGNPVFGPEAGETAGGTRAAFDDADDYHGWSANPPADKQGTTLANAADLTRSASVDLVNPNDLTSISASDQGVKRVVVTVSRSGTTLVTLTTIVTN